MQRSPILGPILGLALVAAMAPAVAGEVFQWKDAQGVTHFSQTPPPSGAYKQRAIGSGGEAQGDKAGTTTALVGENAQCTTARKNLELLKGKGIIQQDTDGDGKPDKTLDDADRTNQMELATAAIKATCLTPVATAKP